MTAKQKQKVFKKLSGGLGRETASAGKFAIVGLFATFTHAFVAATLLETGLMTPYPANITGFVVAFCVSFSGHYWWSFSHLRANSSALKSMFRFLVIAVAGFALNAAILGLWLIVTPWPDVIGLILAILIVPAFTFLGSRLWAFTHHPTDN